MMPTTILPISPNYCLQQWYGLSDPGAEEALYDIHSMRAFAGLELSRDAIPDETTILNFRHLLERHDLTRAIFASVAEHLEARGEMLRGGTIVDATLIAASPSTKNKQQKRDPAMRSSKKGNQWYFGMKAHVGVDAKSGLVHTAGVTTGSVHDAKVMDRLIREDDRAVYGDKGYASDEKKRAAEDAGVLWAVKEKAKPGRKLSKRQPQPVREVRNSEQAVVTIGTTLSTRCADLNFFGGLHCQPAEYSQRQSDSLASHHLSSGTVHPLVAATRAEPLTAQV